MNDDIVNKNQLQITKISEQMSAFRRELQDFKKEVRKSLDRINETLNLMNSRYITKDQIIDLEKDLKEDIKECKNCYVHKNEFKPYKVALNIAGGLLITSVIGALISLVLKS